MKIVIFVRKISNDIMERNLVSEKFPIWESRSPRLPPGWSFSARVAPGFEDRWIERALRVLAREPRALIVVDR